ncbi:MULTISPECIES: ankyrin repeat domain-containing protein [unclassified Campylobacter]|uniref:ankyrin repeat domain-containing protein n=1 Tax=unclassified Campylobacter TaxID=2593542 RepID=UPI0022E9CC4B|nr:MULTISPECIES: ankyrin repeat domain-containing protein [unclassified Campylobacter]MDA3062377.1 ankyrin repeat domain-containing protein [Campylobacter sp. JMF_14 EL1]MDA3073504.1 ankyrin repeat domain-containing protein [Campylobacter sp. JMF_10 EL2]
MKNLLWILPVIFLAIILRIVELDKKKSNFVVTADTNISKNSQLSKYVTQEEVENFAFRYWDIDFTEVKKNPKMEEFRQILKSKDTARILNFISDNNISVDEPLHYGVTAIMYASFYDDENTMKELIKMGADIHKQDNHKISPMAYAMENNSTKAVKLLYENGVKFEEVTMMQTALGVLEIGDFWEFEPYFDENNTAHLIWKNFDRMHRNEHHYTAENFFRTLLRNNQLDILELVLQSGYKPYLYEYYLGGNVSKYTNDLSEADRHYIEFINNYEGDIELARFHNSLYFPILQSPHPRPKIALLRKYNVPIDVWNPSKEFLKKLYNRECHSEWVSAFLDAVTYFTKNNMPRYLEKPNRKTKFLYENCLDKNGTFEDIEEYIVFNQQMKILHKITASEERKFGYGNHNSVDINITSDEIERLFHLYITNYDLDD